MLLRYKINSLSFTTGFNKCGVLCIAWLKTAQQWCSKCCSYLSRTAKSFCCSKAWTKVIRKCLLLSRVENRVMPSSTLGRVVLLAWWQKMTEAGWNIYFSAWFHPNWITHLLRPHLSSSPPLVSCDPSSEHLIFLLHPPSLSPSATSSSFLHSSRTPQSGPLQCLIVAKCAEST